QPRQHLSRRTAHECCARLAAPPVWRGALWSCACAPEEAMSGRLPLHNPKEPAPALRGCNIRKTFRRDTGEIVAALDDVSLEARHGTLTALIGPDGAGKTTLMRLAAGLLAPDAGELQILGLDVATAPQQVQACLGYMPQKFGLYEDLSVLENLHL